MPLKGWPRMSPCNMYLVPPFFGLKLHCDPRALIPRPETEELVQIILDREPSDKMTVADIGTGSGCIALALKSNRPNWKVLGLDVSSDALALAKENAKEQKLDISFNQVNIQDQVDLSGIDVLVSNPPYIPMELESTLDKRVIQYEPSVALFSPESDPFYFLGELWNWLKNIMWVEFISKPMPRI